MKKRNKAFTLIELLVALTISGFIITGMMQGFRNVQKILMNSRQLLQLNREVCLLFNQMERDFNTACIIPEENPSKSIQKQPEKSARDKEKEKKKLNQFKATVYENETKRIEGRTYSLFKSVNFINTNPLQVWSEHRIRLIRLAYQLEKDKEKSTSSLTSYNLYRKETDNIKNEQMKEPEQGTQPTKGESIIYRNLIATNIKSLYLEYVTPKEKSDTDEETEIKTFVWGEKKEQENKVPQYLNIIITFWNDDFTKENEFSFMSPIFAYPTPKKEQKIKPGEPTKTTNPSTPKAMSAKPDRSR